MKPSIILRAFFGRRKLAVAFVLMGGILFCQAALAAEAARFEGEHMSHGTFADEPADRKAENGRTLRYENNGMATYKINLTTAANKIVVRSRNAPASTGPVWINVVIDGVAQKFKRIGSGNAGKTYALRSWPVNLSPGSHTIGVRGRGLRGVDKLLVDNVRLNTPNPYTCDKFASPTGDDAGMGTKADPYRTAAKLFSSTAPGKRGCFREGLYQTIRKTNSGDPLNEIREEIRISGGTGDNAQKTFSNYPGEEATVCAGIRVMSSQKWITFESDVLGNFHLDGTCQNSGRKSNQGRYATQSSPWIQGDSITFRKMDIHKRVAEADRDYYTGVCFQLAGGTDVAENILIEHSAIHHCGVTENGIQPADDPTTAPDNHGFYLSAAGPGTVIRKNLVYHNGERGFQIYPNTQNIKLYGNILYRNYQNVVFDNDSSNNILRNNILTEPRKYGFNVYSPGTNAGRGNKVTDNCTFQRDSTSGLRSSSMYTLSGNLTANPVLTNPGTLAMQMGDASDCRSKYSVP